MQPKEVLSDFSKIAPFDHPPLDLLIEAYAALGAPEDQTFLKSYRNKYLTRASISAEIALHRDASIVRKRRYGQRAYSLMTAQLINNQYLVGGVYTEPLRAHLPLYGAVPSLEKLPQDLGRSLFRIVDGYEGLEPSSGLGFACEVASSMVCNGMGRFGLKAYTAFVRQDTGSTAALNTNFDLMVESDGSTIESGRYPVQVKASRGSRKTRYHPAISTVYFDTLTEYDLTDLKGSMSDLAVRSLAVNGSRGQLRLHTPEQISEKMLDILEETGPLDQEMLLTERVTA